MGPDSLGGRAACGAVVRGGILMELDGIRHHKMDLANSPTIPGLRFVK